jgi:hypothetical protein
LSNEDLSGELPGINSIYPNPSIGEISVEYVSNITGAVELMVYDVSGRVVFTLTDQVGEGENNFHLNLSDLNSGVYFMKTNDGINFSSMKFIIAK